LKIKALKDINFFHPAFFVDAVYNNNHMPKKIKVKKAEFSDFDTAFQHFQSGSLLQAEIICRQIIGQYPNHSDAWHLLGLIARKGGQNNIAIHYISKAIHISPYAPHYYYDIGLSLLVEGYKDEAIRNFSRAIELKPDYAEAHFQIGFILQQQNRLEEAIKSYEQAIMFQPNNAEIFNNMGIVFLEQDNIEAAITSFKRAIILEPDYDEAYGSLGHALTLWGKIDEAIENFNMALIMKPDDVETHLNLGIAYLLAKDFERGWEKYEWRLRLKGKDFQAMPLLKPKWGGSSLENKVILVYGEQGYGDTIQFVRYLPLLHDLGAKKVLFVPRKGLEQLLRDNDLKAEILDSSANVETLDYDTNIHLLSLPGIFKTNLENIPFRQKRYLKANPEKVKWYKEKFFNFPLPTSHFLLKIGIFWQGSSALPLDRTRSMPLHHFHSLCRLPNVRIYSLQKGYGIEQLNDLPEDIEIVNLGETFNDFSDTAAAIENLDLIITVDTAIGHLAGALGKKTWILLRSYAEWRWHLDMDYSPWYEDVRLFRHKELGKKDWEEMMERVIEQVKVEVKDRYR